MYMIFVLAVNGDYDQNGEYNGVKYAHESDARKTLQRAKRQHPELTLTIKKI